MSLSSVQNLARLPVVALPGLADAADRDVNGHEHGGHDLVVAVLLSVFEPAFDDHVVSDTV